MNPSELAADLQEWRETSPAVEVQETEYCRLLGYPRGRVLQGRARELADEARAWYAQHGRPWIFGRRIDSATGSNREVKLGGTTFSSKPLLEIIEAGQAQEAMTVAVCAGKECEEEAAKRWQEGKPDEYFFLEIFGSAVVEHLIVAAGGRICAWAETHGMTVLPHYSPGYSGWDISEQGKLWSLINAKGAAMPGGLEVLSTGMLRPKKSLLAVFALTRQLEKARKLARLVPCEGCSLAGCNYRRAPYRRALPQVENTRWISKDSLQGGPLPP